MAKPKKIEDPVRITVVLSKAQADGLNTTAIKMSAQEGRHITMSEAVRMAIETVYPLAKQKDMFKP